MPGQFPPTLVDVTLDADRDVEHGFMGDRRATEWRYTMKLEVQIDEKTYMDLIAQYQKGGWRGPNTSAVIGALVMNLQNGQR